MNRLTYILPIATICLACSHKTVNDNAAYDSAGSTVVSSPAVSSIAIGYKKGNSNYMIPKATAFRMNGDYADNVAITIGPDGNLTYFPAPSDISPNSRPIDLSNGWWLNRQGIGKNSVFTSYTFDEYAKLENVPSVEQLKNAIIPDSKVERIVTLPYSVGEASSHIKEIKEYLNNEN